MSSIEWTQRTWNPIAGCSLASPGCTNCYAMKMAGRLEAMGLPLYQGLTQRTKAGFVWTGKVNVASDDRLMEPLRARKPAMWFVNSMSDLFHPDVPDAVIDRVFAVMALCPQHVFQVLTKRSARLREYMDRACGRIGDAAMAMRKTDAAIRAGMGPNGLGPLAHVTPGDEWWPLPNVWLGVSVEDQARGDERIPDLLATPAAVRWISAEPLLGPVDLRGHISEPWELIASTYVDSAGVERGDLTGNAIAGLDWIVAGGESGPGARGSTDEVEANMRSLRDQCKAAGVPFFGKQNYRKLPLPEDLMVREFPV